jgi:hypothetical protein
MPAGTESLIPPADVGDEEHVANNMAGAGDVREIASWVVELEDGDSSSGAGYQGDDENDDEVMSNRRQDDKFIVRNLAQ